MDFLVNINARLSHDNDSLRQENQRLLEQVHKYIETGKELVKDAQEKHWNVIALKEAVRVREEQIALFKETNEKLTRHLQKTRSEGAEWKRKVQELTSRGVHLQRTLSEPLRQQLIARGAVPRVRGAVSRVRGAVSRVRGAVPRAPWPAVGDVVEVKNPHREVPQHYYEVLAIGASPHTTYTWPKSKQHLQTHLYPGQYLVIAVNSKNMPEDELVDGTDWDILYIGEWSAEKKVEGTDKYISQFHNYISPEQPLE
jgi:hypothetical protein